MAELKITISCEQLCDDTCGDSSIWRFECDDGFAIEGRVTQWPAPPASDWGPRDTIYVGPGDIGKPLLIGHVRRWSRVHRPGDRCA